MNKFILTSLITLISLNVFAQDSLKVGVDNSSQITTALDSTQSDKTTITSNNKTSNNKLDSIVVNTKKTSKNTEPTSLNKVNWDEYLNIALAFVAAVGTFLTFYQISITNKQQSIKKKFQLAILRDLVRHLYRNKVCVCAVHKKLEDYGFEKYYPSEEHLLKLKVLPEDLHFERFNNSPEHYDALHELELKFRNFNIEVDVALEHFKSIEINKSLKLRDLETLEFKSQYLTKQTIKLMNRLGFKMSNEMLKREIADISDRYISDLDKIKKTNTDDLDKLSTSRIEDERKNYFDKLGLTETLEYDIKSEYEKIGIIDFNTSNSYEELINNLNEISIRLKSQ
jgi:hypothetical protein